MQSSHLKLHRANLVLLAAIAGACILAQPSDSPITISDGSLTIQSAVPWTSFGNTNATTRSHPNAGRSVTKVAITMPGHNQTINFNNQQCTVAIHYAATDLTVATGSNGKGLRITTDFTAFQRGSTDNHLVHKVTNAKISHVTVRQGTQTMFDNDASGGTKIVISYQ